MLLIISLSAISPYLPTSPVLMEFELSSISIDCFLRRETLENLGRYGVTCSMGFSAGSDIVIDMAVYECRLGAFVGIEQIWTSKKQLFG